MKNQHILNQVKSATRIKVRGKHATFIALTFQVSAIYCLNELTGDIELVPFTDVEDVVNNIVEESNAPLPLYSHVLINSVDRNRIGFVANVYPIDDNGTRRYIHDIVQDKNSVAEMQRWVQIFKNDETDENLVRETLHLNVYRGHRRDSLIFLDYNQEDQKLLVADHVAEIQKEMDQIRTNLINIKIQRTDSFSFNAVCDSLDSIKKLLAKM